MKVVYPGDFDPITNGHLHLINRASNFIDQLIIAICRNSNKKLLFSTQERINMIQEVTNKMINVEIKVYDGLLVNFLEQEDTNLILKGLKEIYDFEKEFKISSLNKKQNSDIETIMLFSEGKYNYLNSSIVKEVAEFGGEIEKLVPKNVEKRLMSKFNKNVAIS